MTGTAPGWYRDDPEHPRTLRWYDGARWTQHTRADTDPDVPPGPPPHPPAWTPSYGPPGTYPPPGPPPGPPSGALPGTQTGGAAAVRPPLPKAGPRPEDTQRQALVALGVISALLLAAIVVVIVLLTGYEEPEDASAPTDTLVPAAPADPSTPADPGTPADPSAPAEPAADSPEAVAEAFVTALLEGRCPEALGYLAEEMQPGAAACAELPIPQGLGGMVEPVVEPATVTGDRAEVTVGFATPGTGEPLPGTGLVLQMVREDSGWRIQDLTLR